MAAEDLTTLANVRSFLQKQTSDTQQDAVINALITRASHAIMRYAEREFAPAGSSGVVRTFEHDGRSMRLDFAPYDARAVTQVRDVTDAANVHTLATTEYRLWPVPNPDGTYQALRFYNTATSWSYLPNRLIEVTGTWGFAAVPSEVEHFCIVTVATWLRRDVSAFSTVLKLDEDRIERPEALPSAVIQGLGRWKRHAYV